MVRSLYSGISGLRNHQVSMDVTGNNIANVNTTGFKAGRVTFEESLAQLLKGSSRPPGNAGGTNPIQVGLGMSIGSIDTLLNQGNLQSTGQITDLAIEGRAYFAYSSGEGTFYSRNGSLQMDSTGRLVSPTNGFTLQGMMADNNGDYPAGSRIGDVRIPFGEKAPANTTTQVQYSSNLDSDSEGLGTIAHTQRFLADAAGANGLTTLFDDAGNSLGIQAGDVITISAQGATPVTLSVTDVTTLADLVTSINTVIQSPPYSPLNQATINADGTINVTASGATVNNLMLSSSRPGSNSYVSNAFTWGPSIPSTNPTGVDSAALRRPAIAGDAIADIYDAAGYTMGLENGDTIQVSGSIGGNTTVPQSAVYDPSGATAGSINTLQGLLDLVQQTFNLPQYDGTPQNNLSVSMNTANTPSDRIPDGSVTIRGPMEEAFSLTNIAITADNANNNATAPTRFNTNTVTDTIQDARDVGRHSTSIVVYDESGDSHIMTTTFTHTGTPNEWLWDITMDGGEQILSGNSGTLTFGQDGSPASITFDDSSTQFRFDPMNGSNIVSIQLDIGSPGSFEGITQFRSPSTTAARFQDGYPMGKLQEISIDEYGEISGLYSNGVSQAIAQVYIAEFNNPAGLLKIGNSMYQQSNNTGEAVMQRPGIGSSSKIKPGALEMSNVELATEFTNMITIQRGYQANARVITTSDSLLQELVQLVR
ncbi:MAG: flagellar hook-basal body complex protein [Chitinivibrionales bacterium]|nr:flagellar hook-basal body complex protein [Chitinivibrionales bacterium]